ncbi:CLUMA_CG018304, isoform A [Clunio marinus]|uniref:CLUMA_CG018304, isoform A n=1 Tax=Clunio marinus TaxID=568069 RepID=A0A1J1IYC8_9DIPT|nr:CLUMA_CG018304, isoform A [Clunio marinus]
MECFYTCKTVNVTQSLSTVSRPRFKLPVSIKKNFPPYDNQRMFTCVYNFSLTTQEKFLS